jgi:hypothetical protein
MFSYTKFYCVLVVLVGVGETKAIWEFEWHILFSKWYVATFVQL